MNRLPLHGRLPFGHRAPSLRRSCSPRHSGSLRRSCSHRRLSSLRSVCCGIATTLALVLILSLPPAPSFAQDSLSFRRTAHSSLFGFGVARQQDTYLSPLDYRGPQLNFLHETQRQTHLLDSCVSFQTLLQADLAYTHSQSENANDLGGYVHFDVAWHFHLVGGPSRSASPFRLLLGPQLGTTIGGLYNTRNGNNPAQATAEVHLSASVAAVYRFRLWRQPLILRDQVDIPLLGAMFSPAYGQSYYELFSLGHRDHNVRFTSPFNAPSLRNQFTVDLPLRRCTLRVGYLADFRQSHVNDIRHHTYSHSFLLGWVRHLSIERPRR